MVVRTRPVMLGGSVKLYCTSESGDPPPSLTWRRAGVPLPAAGQSVDSGAVTSSVMIEQVTTSDQGSTISCTAHNSLLIQPQTTSVLLDVIGKRMLRNDVTSYLVILYPLNQYASNIEDPQRKGF